MTGQSEIKADVVLVGGGLANGLIALQLKDVRPHFKIVLLERDSVVGGQHTWCHFASDVEPRIAQTLEPLIVHRWSGYEVRFPAHRRQLTTEYRAITSERLHQVVTAAYGEDVWLNVEVESLTPWEVVLKDGRVIKTPCVIDGRGARSSPHLALGWQKFLGREVELAAPHGLTRPIVMDATVDQLDGYRFLYVLPFSPTRLLIEDTRYADGPALDRETLRADIAAYAAAQGWTIRSVEREEDGILPIALAGDIDAFWNEAPEFIPQVGLRAALFQPTTGYSLPDAARLSLKIGLLATLTSRNVRYYAETASKAAWRERGFYRLLNRMLFRACAPERRYRVLERFYRLGQPLIERFYAGRATLADKLRVLSGKPPVPVTAALAVLKESSAFKDVND